MKKAIVIFVLFLNSSFCFAQQRIAFDLNQGGWTKKYTLPKSVTCTFKDGTKQRLVLENVKGDSLIFQKYYNQSQSFDCAYSSLKKIKVHDQNETVTYSIFFVSLGAAIAGIATIAILGSSVQNDPGDPSHGVAMTLVPVTILPLLGTIVTSSLLPKHYQPKDWKLYAE